MRMVLNLVMRLLGSSSTGTRTRSTSRTRPARAGTTRGGTSGGLLSIVRRALR